MNGLTPLHSVAGKADGGCLSVGKNASLSLVNVSLLNCTAGNRGGAVFVGKHSQLTVRGALISDCRAGRDGGGMYLDTGASLEMSESVLQDASAGFLLASELAQEDRPEACISNESWTGGGGGGCDAYVGYAADSASAKNNDSSVTATYSGNISYTETSASFCDLARASVDCCFCGGGIKTKIGGRGGVVFASSQTSLAIASSSFLHTSARFEGGALFLDANSSLDLSGVAFHNTSAGGYCWDGPPVLEASRCQSDEEWNDDWGDDCADYALNPGWCGIAESNDKCCVCGGGVDMVTGRPWGDLVAEFEALNCAPSGQGGAIFAAPTTIVSMSSVVVRDSIAGEGGALYLRDSVKLHAWDSDFAGCHALVNGGAIFASTAGVESTCQSDPHWADKNYAWLNCAQYWTYSTYCGVLDEDARVKCCACGGGSHTMISEQKISISIRRSTFVSSTAATHGGAVYLQAGMLVLQNSLVQGNSAGTYGGGLYLKYSALRGHGTTIDSNQAERGGGMLARFYSSIELEGTMVSRNVAKTLGGGIFLDQSSLTVSRSAIDRNMAGDVGPWDGQGALVQFVEGRDGGGVCASLSSVIAVHDSSITRNVAADDGAGFYGQLRSSFTINNSTIDGNAAGGNGGAGFALAFCAVDLFQVSFSNNFAIHGGGMYFQDVAVTAKSSSFTNNGAMEGGALLLKRAPMTATNSIFDSNRGFSESNGSAILVGRDSRAGAILLETSQVSLVNCSIIRNSADDGGGVLAILSSSLQLHGSSISYNLATLYGGGASIDTNSVLHLSSSSVHSNIVANTGGNTVVNVPGLGGGVSTTASSTVELRGNASISNNYAHSGGGLYVEESTVIVVSCAVYGNTAEADAGGIYAVWSSTIQLRERSSLSGNSARNGAGAYVQRSTLSLTDSDIDSNHGHAGGGLYADISSKISLHGKVSVSMNTAEGSGGGFAIFASSTLSVAGETSMKNNAAIAGSAGGVLASTSLVSVSGVLDFVNNTAGDDGGAAMLTAASSLADASRMGEPQRILMTRNRALRDGGALAVSGDSEVSLTSEFIVAQNTAGRRGGGIFVGADPFASENAMPSESNTTTCNPSRFEVGALNLTGNKAVADGGGLFSYGSISLLADGFTTATLNTALRGGAVALSDAQLELQHGHILTAAMNSARESGGALALISGASLSIAAPNCPSSCGYGDGITNRLDSVCDVWCMSAECNWDKGACEKKMESAGVDATQPCNRQECSQHRQSGGSLSEDESSALENAHCEEGCFNAACDWSRESCAPQRINVKRCPLIDAVAYMSLRAAQEYPQANLSFLTGGNSMGGFGRCNSACDEPAMVDLANASKVLGKGKVGGGAVLIADAGHEMWLHAPIHRAEIANSIADDTASIGLTLEMWVQVPLECMKTAKDQPASKDFGFIIASADYAVAFRMFGSSFWPLFSWTKMPAQACALGPTILTSSTGSISDGPGMLTRFAGDYTW